jgi:hypothetical protein
MSTKFKVTLTRYRVQLFGFLFGTGIFYFLSTLKPIALKQIPMPWLVCWSDPLAVGACPAGSIQHFFTVDSFPFFAVGFLAVIAVIFARMTCGWLCPFGFVQDLIYKMKKVTKWIVVALFMIIIGYLCWTSPMFAGNPLRTLLRKGQYGQFYLWFFIYLIFFGGLFSLYFIKFKSFTIGVKFSNYGRFFFFLIPFIIFSQFTLYPLWNVIISGYKINGTNNVWY